MYNLETTSLWVLLWTPCFTLSEIFLWCVIIRHWRTLLRHHQTLSYIVISSDTDVHCYVIIRHWRALLRHHQTLARVVTSSSDTDVHCYVIIRHGRTLLHHHQTLTYIVTSSSDIDVHCYIIIRQLLDSIFKEQKSPYRRSRWTHRDFSSVRLPTHSMTSPRIYVHVMFVVWSLLAKKPL
jgi:hypothetical protein